MFSFLIFLNPVITNSGPSRDPLTPLVHVFMLPLKCHPFRLVIDLPSLSTLLVLFTVSFHHQLDSPAETKFW